MDVATSTKRTNGTVPSQAAGSERECIHRPPPVDSSLEAHTDQSKTSDSRFQYGWRAERLHLGRALGLEELIWYSTTVYGTRLLLRLDYGWPLPVWGVGCRKAGPVKCSDRRQKACKDARIPRLGGNEVVAN